MTKRRLVAAPKHAKSKPILQYENEKFNTPKRNQHNKHIKNTNETHKNQLKAKQKQTQ